MQRRTLACAVLLVAAATLVLAQDAPEQAFEWRLSGDTVDTFKAEFKLHIELDQSSARAVVESYAQLTDSRHNNMPAERHLNHRANDLIAEATASIYDRLLTQEARDAREKDIEQSALDTEEMQYRAEATRILAENAGENGAILIETAQKATYRNRAWESETGGMTGEWQDQEHEEFLRYTCVRGSDGKWRIDRIETRRMDWAASREADEEVYSWTDMDPAIRAYMEARKTEPFTVAELKQDTPENAAMAVFSHLVPLHHNHLNRIYAESRVDWAKAISSLLTENLANREFSARELHPREVLSVEDGEDGLKLVQFNSRSEWRGPVEVQLRKDGDVWKIVRAGSYTTRRENGERVIDRFVEEPRLLSLNWR
jgi:hypothetical protein